jgi:CheY-like chemotaxis protein/HPt (histidine-containing phosphotransfer) domain-containing protein
VSSSKLDELEAHLASVRRAAEAGFAERARALRDAAAALDGGDESARDEIRRLAHKLRGIGGSVGHAELSERAARLEQAARGPAAHLAISEGARRLATAVVEPELRSTSPVAVAPRALASRRLEWRVVALDDESATRRLLQIALQHAGCDAIVFDDPAAAMKSVVERVPDLVIVDAMMPNVDGLDFYRGVRLHAGHRVPVVILSAATALELGWELPEDARLVWMRKPFRPADLIDALRAFVEGA